MSFLRSIVLYPLTILIGVIKTVFNNDAGVTLPRRFLSGNISTDTRARLIIEDLTTPFDESHHILLLRMYYRFISEGLISIEDDNGMSEETLITPSSSSKLISRINRENSFYAAARNTSYIKLMGEPPIPYMLLRDAARLHSEL